MKLKRFIELFILFFFFGIVTCQSQASIPKVEKIYKNVPELIICTAPQKLDTKLLGCFL